jgi:hypothetical protein
VVKLLTVEWAEHVRRLLDASPEFSHNARVLSGTIYLYDQSGGVSLRFDRGSLSDVVGGPDARGSQWRIGGTRDEWHRALGGEADFFQATDPRVGNLALDGDAIRLAGSAKAFMMIWDALKRATGK